MAKRNINDEELMALCIAIEQRYKELFGRAKGASFKKNKDDAWNDVKADLLAQGFKIFESKTVADLRDNVYGYRKRQVESKWQNSQKTGGAGVNWKNWEEVIIRIEKFSTEAEVIMDVGDSNDPLTDWQKGVEKAAVVKEESPILTASTPASSSGLSMPRIESRLKRPRPLSTVEPKRSSADELKIQLMEKELELKSKQITFLEVNTHFKQKSIELVEWQIAELKMRLTEKGEYAIQEGDPSLTLLRTMSPRKY